MAQIVLERLRRKFGAAILETHNEHGDETAVVETSRLREVAEFLRDDRELQFNLPVDCTAVDYLGRREPRFEVIWHLYSVPQRHRVRIKVRVTEEDPSCPALTLVWPGMDWHEREAWDMYGIRFVGHPNLKRVLMYEEFVGFPLRKDYPVDKRQPLIEMRQVREVPTQRHPPPEMLNRP
jgi:NADH-quinone oxidoreductase subunit C